MHVWRTQRVDSHSLILVTGLYEGQSSHTQVTYKETVFACNLCISSPTRYHIQSRQLLHLLFRNNSMENLHVFSIDGISQVFISLSPNIPNCFF